jgi:hypothetical protein
MRKEFLTWLEREGLLLSSVSSSGEDPEHDEVKITIKAPIVALSSASPDPVLFGYPESSLDMTILQDLHEFVLTWFEKAVQAGMARCFVCNKMLDIGNKKPWDAVFISSPLYCWLVVHFDCKRYLNRDLKGRNPFEVTAAPPEYFDMRLE